MRNFFFFLSVWHICVRAALVCELAEAMTADDGMRTCKSAWWHVHVHLEVLSGMFSCGGSGMFTCKVVSGMFSCGGDGMFTCRVVSGMFSCGGGGMFTCKVVSGMFSCGGGGMFTCRVVRGMFSCGDGGMFTCNSAGGGPDVHNKFCRLLVIQSGGGLQCPRVRV
jgi:hypothetical protein